MLNQINKNLIIQFTLLLCLMCYTTLRSFILVSREGVNPWTATHWLLSYESGFISRGFVGSIVSLFNPILSFEELVIILLSIFVGIFLITVGASIAVLKQNNFNFNVFLFLVLFITHPSFLPLFTYDLGRFDVLLFILTCVSIFLIVKGRSLFILFLMIISGLFIHEAYMVLYIPYISMLLLFCYGKNLSYRITWVAIIFFLTSVMTIFILAFGKPAVTFVEFIELVKSKAEFEISEEMIEMEYYFTLTDHIQYTMAYYSLKKNLIHLVYLVLLMPTFMLFFVYWRRMLQVSENRFKVILLILSTFTPLLLSIIGIDLGRWLAVSITLNFLTILIFDYLGVYKITALVNSLGVYSRFIILGMIIFHLYLGPFSYVNPFEHFINR